MQIPSFDGEGGSFFEPEIRTLAQMADKSRRDPGAHPERRLMVAVLEDAILTCLRLRERKNAADRKQLEEVERWIHASDSTWIYSFEHICDALGFEPDAVRRALVYPCAHRGQRRIGRRSRRLAGTRHAIGAG